MTVCECGGCTYCQLLRRAETAEAEVYRLRDELLCVRYQIISNAKDTIWMDGGAETVVDHIEHVLEVHGRGEG
jgi:hypothetical protein